MEPKDELLDQQKATKDDVAEQYESSQDENNDMAPGSTVTRASKKQKQEKTYKEVVDWIKSIVIAVVLVAIVRIFLFSPFIVDGDSMEPNFHTHERVIVNLLIYNISKPEYGDVVVFDVPEEGRRFIKRIIGVPGDTIKVEGDQLYINDKLITEPYLTKAIAESMANGTTYNGIGDSFSFPNESYPDNVVPEGMYYVMGDNRGYSKDSRAIGYVSEDEIIGRADVVMWPLDKLELVKHYN
ncbi:signal peptidase I [Paenibacillus endoradicis]|uniref:signal peptidase I n=1 Tax=Paenibacillus endoradicis TaxID=2972487 RepID=UPI0021593EA4|nr:signal peptidase I [Paenibacillus endoradicis]MCR8656220.1 signal peptidase I [Paenibacillus endoradicis]